MTTSLSTTLAAHSEQNLICLYKNTTRHTCSREEAGACQELAFCTQPGTPAQSPAQQRSGDPCNQKIYEEGKQFPLATLHRRAGSQDPPGVSVFLAILNCSGRTLQTPLHR